MEKIIKDFKNQIRFIPKEIRGDDGVVKIEITNNPEEMKIKDKIFMKGYYSSEKKLIKLLIGDEMGKCLLHEWIHSVIFESGFKHCFLGVEEEVFTKIMTRGVRQYLVACQTHNLTLTKLKKIKEKKK